jgi:hypothetical protein
MKINYTLFLLALIVSSCLLKDHSIPDPEVETIYLAGFERKGGVSVATLWKNGVALYLTDGTHDAEALAVVTTGADVYVAGKERITGNQFMAKYWKNGQPVELTDKSQTATVDDIFVSGSDVYVNLLIPLK